MNKNVDWQILWRKYWIQLSFIWNPFPVPVFPLPYPCECNELVLIFFGHELDIKLQQNRSILYRTNDRQSFVKSWDWNVPCKIERKSIEVPKPVYHSIFRRYTFSEKIILEWKPIWSTISDPEKWWNTLERIDIKFFWYAIAFQNEDDFISPRPITIFSFLLLARSQPHE